MSSPLQQLADRVGNALRRSVTVDDPHLRLLAHTPHPAGVEVDPARVAALVRGVFPADLTAYIERLGALEARDLFTVPALPDRGLTIARIAVPIRYDDALVGFIWLLESEGPVGDAQARLLREAAEEAGVILYRQLMQGELDRERERALTRDLLAADPQLRLEAAASLLAEGLLVSGQVVALTVTLPHAGALTDADRVAIAAGLGHARRQVPSGHAVDAERPGHGILIVSRPARRSGPSIAELGSTLRDEVLAKRVQRSGPCLVGIGGERETLAEVHASYAEALRAADVARVVPSLGPVVEFGRLGVYSLLSLVPAGDLRSSLHPGLDRLRETDRSGALRQTLEVFLDNAGSVKRTAQQLSIQPASLYYRLHRIEEVAKVDLADGDDRLALHLSLKISHLLAPSPSSS